MASFQEKIGSERLRKKEKKKKKIVPMSSYPTRNIKFLKNSKKIQKIKNIIMASFQAEIGSERLRKIENKRKSFR